MSNAKNTNFQHIKKLSVKIRGLPIGGYGIVLPGVLF